MPSAKELAKALARQDSVTQQPRNRFLGAIADAAGYVSDQADRYVVPERDPLFGGMRGGDLLPLRNVNRLLDDLSYGGRITTGRGQTTTLRPEVVDTVGLGGAMRPFIQKGGEAALKTLAEQVQNKTGILGRNVIDPRQQIITYHGSPHTFPPTANNPLGEFDPMKVGTGEGAQAYGVGAGYLAESKDLATGYRGRLSTNYLGSKGEQIPSGEVWSNAKDAVKQASNMHPDRARAIASHIQDYVDSGSKAENYFKEFDVPASLRPAYQAAIDKFSGITPNPGNLYKVDLPDEHVAKMLNWDKPLSEQHPSVQSALAKLDPDLYHPTGNEYSPDEVGAEIYLRMANSPLAKNQSDASEVMRNAGITGIRYLDAASRDAAGKGTSNFVVFDPKHMNILERNGVGGAMIQRPKTEFEILHDTAQRNAALPVDQGGLGLPANNTYIDRANAPGMFPTDAYHATNVEFDSFDPSKTKFVNGVFTSTDPSGASAYVEAKNAGLPTKHEGGFVMPLRINNEKSVTPEYFNLNNIRSGLAEGNNVVGGDVVVIPNAKNIRSRFAAFDPFRRHEADILAGVGVGGMLDPQAIAEALRQQDRK